MQGNKGSEKMQWRSLPSKLKEKWLAGKNLLEDERNLWEKHAPEVFEDVACYSQGLLDNVDFSNVILVIIKFFNTTKQKRQLAYAYEYKANLLSQAKEANVQPSPIEYEFACENIGYELGFVCGFISAMKK
jgi:hypothetical protein